MGYLIALQMHNDKHIMLQANVGGCAFEAGYFIMTKLRTASCANCAAQKWKGKDMAEIRCEMAINYHPKAFSATTEPSGSS